MTSFLTRYRTVHFLFLSQAILPFWSRLWVKCSRTFCAWFPGIRLLRLCISLCVISWITICQNWTRLTLRKCSTCGMLLWGSMTWYKTVIRSWLNCIKYFFYKHRRITRAICFIRHQLWYISSRNTCYWDLFRLISLSLAGWYTSSTQRLRKCKKVRVNNLR